MRPKFELADVVTQFGPELLWERNLKQNDLITHLKL